MKKFNCLAVLIALASGCVQSHYQKPGCFSVPTDAFDFQSSKYQTDHWQPEEKNDKGEVLSPGGGMVTAELCPGCSEPNGKTIAAMYDEMTVRCGGKDMWKITGEGLTSSGTTTSVGSVITYPSSTILPVATAIGSSMNNQKFYFKFQCKSFNRQPVNVQTSQPVKAAPKSDSPSLTYILD